MVHAYQVTGLDFYTFFPLIESLIENGDLGPGSTAIAYPKEDPGAKNIYVASSLPVLKDTEDIKTLDRETFAEICHRDRTGIYRIWGNSELF